MSIADGRHFLPNCFIFIYLWLSFLSSPSPFKPTPAIVAGSASHHPDKQPLAHFFWPSQPLLFIVVFSVATNWHF